MDRLIDISVPLKPGMVQWPGSPEFVIQTYLRLDQGDTANVSRYETDIHAGTHVDAPWHFLEDGARLHELALNGFIGPAFVADLRSAAEITADILGNAGIPAGCERLILKTDNSRLWESGSEAFTPEFVALTTDAAEWVVDQGIRLVGIDYLSIQKFGAEPDVHVLLLQAGVLILETLDLSDVEPGDYELICLPLHMLDTEGAPARAVLRTLNKEE